VAAQFNSYTNHRQRRIQSTLSAYGYYRGAIDGSFGPGTYNATVAYANATGRSNLLGTMVGARSIYKALLF
jgi:peptidoglycan hydrolase-like protein with peptidoglycan-binding domain